MCALLSPTAPVPLCPACLAGAPTICWARGCGPPARSAGRGARRAAPGWCAACCTGARRPPSASPPSSPPAAGAVPRVRPQGRPVQPVIRAGRGEWGGGRCWVLQGASTVRPAPAGWSSGRLLHGCTGLSACAGTTHCLWTSAWGACRWQALGHLLKWPAACSLGLPGTAAHRQPCMCIPHLLLCLVADVAGGGGLQHIGLRDHPRTPHGHGPVGGRAGGQAGGWRSGVPPRLERQPAVVGPRVC